MKKIILVIVIAVGIYLVFRFFLPLVIPFLIAGIVSVLYYPVLRKIYKDSGVWESKRKKWILVLSVVLLYVTLLLVLGCLCGYLVGQCQSIWLNFPFYKARFIGVLQDCCQQVDVFLRMERGESYGYVEEVVAGLDGISLSGMIPKVTTYSVHLAGVLFGLVFEVIVTVMATFFMIQDYEKIREEMLESAGGRAICRLITKCKDTLKMYLKAQGLIMLLDGILCTLAFMLIGHPYYLVFGPLVAVLDALPVLGAGVFLIPYALYLLLTSELWKVFVVLLTYIGCVVIRQLTEPRMIGSKMELRPVFTLLSMYVGFRLFGIIGFLLGPVGVLVGQELYKYWSGKLS